MGFPGSILLNQGDIYTQTADKRHPLGTRGYTRDGRVFRYSKAGAADLSVGLLMCSPVTPSDEAIDELFSSDYETPTTSSTVIYLSTGTSLTTAGYYNDGFCWICDGTGEGQIIQIKSDAGATTAAADVFPTFYPYEEDKLTATVTTSSEIGLVKNQYDGIIVRPDSAATSVPRGITPRAVTTLYYFWLQTWGMCPVLTAGTVVLGHAVIAATATGTSVGEIVCITTLASTATDVHVQEDQAIRVGNIVVVGATTDYSLIDLHLAP